MSNPSILVIDDDSLTRQLLGRSLERRGFEVTSYGDVREALEALEEHVPDLLVLDYEMPEFNGAQVCQYIRGNPAAGIADLPIILLTAHAGEDHEVECLEAGANDFVSKPVNAAVLSARIETHLRLHALRAQLQQQNTELERWRRSRELDLDAARVIQKAILPPRAPEIAAWDIAAYYEPVIQVGGDMYDWMRLEGGRWLFWIADVTGHGASAALLTALSKLVFRHAAEETDLPCEILKVANTEFHSVLRGKSFMTAGCLVLSADSGEIRFAGAGHPPLLIIRASGEVETIYSDGPPLGVLPVLNCGELSAVLEPGDTALLYTDGIYSGRKSGGERFTPEDLLEFIPKSSVDGANGYLATVLETAKSKMSECLPDDDVAIIALRRLGAAEQARQTASPTKVLE